MVLGNDDLYPLVCFGKSQFSVSTQHLDAVKTHMKKPLPISEELYKQIMTTKGVPSRAASRWESLITVTNVSLLHGKEGEYPYIAFDVENHPEQKKKLIAIPSDVATKIFPKIFEDATANQDEYGLKLDDPDEAIRERHRARLEIFEWVPGKCTKLDSEGNSKPCMISPLVNGWSQVPIAHHIPNLGKAIAVEAASDVPKPGALKSKAGGIKRKAVELPAGISDSSTELPEALSRIVTVDTCGSDYKVVEHGGIVMIHMFRKKSKAATHVAEEEEQEDEEEEDD